MVSKVESTSASLIFRVQNNDQAAWTRLSLLYGPLVYKWARRVGLREDDAADIGQEVFRTAARRISQFDIDQSCGGFRAWLRQITRNKIGDFFRQSYDREVAAGGSDLLLENMAVFEFPDEFDKSTEVDDRNELFDAVLRLIQTDFQENTWQAFWRSTIEDQPIQRIAEDLGMTTKAIRQAKYRVLKRLRDEFSDLLS